MKKTLEENNLNSIIRFQQMFKLLIIKRDNCNSKIKYCKTSLISMISNLNYFNKINIFTNTNLGFIGFLNELLDIKKLVEKLPEKVKIKDIVSENNSSNFNKQVSDIINLQIRYSNHICYENIERVLVLFTWHNWKDYFNK